jgi:chloride channel 3/4/5
VLILAQKVAFLVDISVATLSDFKLGFCSPNPLRNREACCANKSPFINITEKVGEDCTDWNSWSDNYWASFAYYVGFALLFGILAGSVTISFSKANLPVPKLNNDDNHAEGDRGPLVGKSMYMAAGSGIPEIKTILSGFVIPHFLDLRVLCVKAIGATLAVATGLCLGKEGPFVHISTFIGYLVSSLLPKYRENGRKMREMLSVACSSGLSVAFGAPIGGVLFSYEVSDHEIFA